MSKNWVQPMLRRITQYHLFSQFPSSWIANLALIASVAICPAVAFGQPAVDMLTLQVKIISLSQDTATSLCPKPSEAARRTNTEINGAVKAELPGLMKKVLDVGGQIATTYQNTTTEGVLEVDLSDLIKASNDCRVKVFMFLTERLLGGPAPSVVANQPISRLTPIVATQSATVTSPPQPQIGPVIRIFPKVNITKREAIALASLLPTFTVQTGSSRIDARNYADTLFVNRDKVSPSEVVSAARALGKLGVHVKSIQQSQTGGRREIQVGTGLDPKDGAPLFQNLSPIDLEKLSRLDGSEFWRQAFNGGPVLCMLTLGYFELCQVASDGRPVKIRQ